jgi:hypothetical protein
MNLQTRVEKLESALGVGDDGGLCKCPTMSVDMRVYGTGGTSAADCKSDTRPAGVCAACGKPKQIIKIVVCRTRADVEASR